MLFREEVVKSQKATSMFVFISLRDYRHLELRQHNFSGLRDGSSHNIWQFAKPSSLQFESDGMQNVYLVMVTTK